MDDYKNNFVVLILSHGRPDNVVTYRSLERSGYTGPVYIVVDDMDKTKDQYIEKYGDKVVVFEKAKIAATVDQGDNFNDLRTTTHVRNASFEIAKNLGYKYFVQLDDDYVKYDYRFNDIFEYQTKTVRNLDDIFSSILKFYISSEATSVALSQGGDFIGGGSPDDQVRLKRKCMNSFFCSTDRPFKFISRLNEDVNTYLTLGSKGHLFFTIMQVSLTQLQTQSNSGGMTDSYLNYGTYVKSFYSVMYQPSSVKIRKMSGRLHHSISWKNTVPMILSEALKK